MNTYPNPFADSIDYQRMEQHYDQEALDTFNTISPMTRTQ